MATTQIADIYNPLVFQAGVEEKELELNAFVQSGVITPSPQLDQLANIGGNIGEVPFGKNLDTTAEPDYTTDDPTDVSTPAKVTQGKMIYRLASMAKSWSTMDLTRELALIDPLGSIIGRVGKWWATQKEKRVIASANGILADNDANDSDDMFINIYSDVASPAATNIISADAFLDTRQTSGDHQNIYSVVAMHSVTYNNLNKQNLIDFIPNSQGLIDFPTYFGMRVVVDDSMPVVAGTNSPRYTTLLFQPGAFDSGKGAPMVPSELERIPAAGEGGGQDVIHSRSSDIIHPYGFQFTSSSVAGTTATLAELALAVNWDRVVDRKNVGIAALYHNN